MPSMTKRFGVSEKQIDSPEHHKAHDARASYSFCEIRSKPVRQYYWRCATAGTIWAPDIRWWQTGGAHVDETLERSALAFPPEWRRHIRESANAAHAFFCLPFLTTTWHKLNYDSREEKHPVAVNSSSNAIVVLPDTVYGSSAAVVEYFSNTDRLTRSRRILLMVQPGYRRASISE